MRQVTFKHVFPDGSRVHTFVLTMNKEEWAERPESGSELWQSSTSDDGIVVACATRIYGGVVADAKAVDPSRN